MGLEQKLRFKLQQQPLQRTMSFEASPVTSRRREIKYKVDVTDEQIDTMRSIKLE